MRNKSYFGSVVVVAFALSVTMFGCSDSNKAAADKAAADAKAAAEKAATATKDAADKAATATKEAADKAVDATKDAAAAAPVEARPGGCPEGPPCDKKKK